MVTIKLFGTLRLKTGFKGMETEAADVMTVCKILSAKTDLPVKEFKRCVITINGKQSKASASLRDGDEVAFFTPSGGG